MVTSAFLAGVPRVGSSQHPHNSNFCAESYFAVLGDSMYYLYIYSFIPPDLLATLIAPTTAILSPLGSCGVSIQAEHVSLPSHALDMLAARNRQLAARGLSPPKLHSLVGCSTPAALSDLALAVVQILPSAFERASASATMSDFGAESSRPAISLSTLQPASHPARGKTRYRSVSYDFDRAGLSPAGFVSKGFIRSS